jgi:hypothetical protein
VAHLERGKNWPPRLRRCRPDGTLHNPVTIWAVHAEDDLYVRSVKVRAGPWFRGTRARCVGRISAGGVEKDVTFEDGNPARYDEMTPLTARIIAAMRPASSTVS